MTILQVEQNNRTEPAPETVMIKPAGGPSVDCPSEIVTTARPVFPQCGQSILIRDLVVTMA
jgi:hypothetical protein